MSDDNVIQFPMGRIGNKPAPSDSELVTYITEMRERDAVELESLLSELETTDTDAQADGQPEVFVYARLVNYLTSDEVSLDSLIHLAASAIWNVYGQEENGTDNS